MYLGSSFNVIYAFCARNCGIFSPTVNNMEMLKIAGFQRWSAYVRWGDLAGLARGYRRSLNQEAAGVTRHRGPGTRSRSRRFRLPHREREDTAALRGGGAAAAGRGGGRLLSPSGRRRVTWARGAAAIGPRHVSRRPARDVTRGGSVKNKNKNPESKCLRLR